MALKLLIAYASNHGSTAEIAQVIGESIRKQGLLVDVQPAREVRSLDGYDAVIAGSVVQVGRWHREAIDFLKRFERELAVRPTWLFSSGPTGGSEKADAEVVAALKSPEGVPAPKELERYFPRIHPRAHVTFPGRVEKGVGGIFARWVPTGDWRDFEAIKAWADGIATAMNQAVAPATANRR